MDDERVALALVRVWDELPRLAGTAWAALHARLEGPLARLRELGETADPAVRAGQVAELVLILRTHPRVRDRMRAEIESLATEEPLRGVPGRDPEGDRDLREPPPWPAIQAGLERCLGQAPAVRYSDVTAPRRLGLRRRGVVTAGLTRALAVDNMDSEAAPRLELQPRSTVEVHLQAESAHVEVVGETVRRLRVEEGADSDPAVFYVRGAQAGNGELLLDFRQDGVSVGLSRLSVAVQDETPLDEQVRTGAEILTGGPYAPPPDLDLRITTRERGRQTDIDFILHSPNGAVDFHYHRIPGRPLLGSPRGYQRRIAGTLAALARGSDVDGRPLSPRQVETRLAGLGRQLYEDLFPEELRQAYRRFRDSIETLLITSDEPWIPWELVRPYEDGDPDDRRNDFLCSRFQVSRWLSGRSAPAGRIRVSRLACIEAGSSPGRRPLPSAAREAHHLLSLARSSPGVRDVSPDPATLESVEALLDQGDVGLWHFAGHGDTHPRRAGDSLVLLADGHALRPEDLHGPRQTRIGHDRPLVFLNACHAGEIGRSLTRLAGWAAAWVDRCRCGAFVAPVWRIHDGLAGEFARSFYDALWSGQTMGRAAQISRHRLRDAAPHDPAWLSYTVYGHPHARLALAPAAP